MNQKKTTIQTLLLSGFGLAVLMTIGMGIGTVFQFNKNVSNVEMMTKMDTPILLSTQEVMSNLLMHRRH